jgi:hypothetical protein
LPPECKGGRGSQRATLHWTQIIKNIRGDSIKDRMGWNACCTGKRFETTGDDELYFGVGGDTGCKTKGSNGFNFIVKKYPTRCGEIRAAGRCGPPHRAGGG